MQELVKAGRVLSLALHVERYLSELLGANLSEATVKAYRDRLGYFAAWLASTGIPLDQVTRDTILQYLSDMQAAGLSPKYRRDRLSAVKCLFSWLVDEKEILPRNPVARLRRAIRVPRRLPRFLEESDAKKVMEAARTGKSKEATNG